MLRGLSEAIGNTWPLAIFQTCVLHLIRSTFRFPSKRDWDKMAFACCDSLVGIPPRYPFDPPEAQPIVNQNCPNEVRKVGRGG